MEPNETIGHSEECRDTIRDLRLGEGWCIGGCRISFAEIRPALAEIRSALDLTPAASHLCTEFEASDPDEDEDTCRQCGVLQGDHR